MELAIIDSGARIVIIDNLTYLSSESEKAKDAKPLMQRLKALKSKHGLSILVLAHTPKRDLSKKISQNHLTGSKMLMNFCDSSFTIGVSHQEKQMRYIKQIKVRNKEVRYDSGNVAICRIDKLNNFLQLHLVGFGTEDEQLYQPKTNEYDAELAEEVVRLKDVEGKSFQEIADELGLNSKMKAKRIYDKHNDNS